MRFWFVVLSALMIVSCGGDKGSAEIKVDSGIADLPGDRTQAQADESSPRETAEVIAWQTFYEPGLEKRDGIWILKLKGTPYEMGVQHATFMYDQILEAVEYFENSEMKLLEPIAQASGFLDEALVQSYPVVIEECQGVADVMSDVGWTLERCLLFAYADIILDYFQAGLLSCTQFAVTDDATPDGEFMHARNMDWDHIQFVIDHPTVIVRHPDGGIPHVYIGYPTCVAPTSGFNAAGVSICSNEAHSENDLDREGRPHIQMLYKMLGESSSLDDALEFLQGENHMSAEIFFIADGDNNRAAGIEMSATHLAWREMNDDHLVWITNHFLEPEMVPFHIEYPPEASSKTRLTRVQELLPPGGKDSLYGTLDVSGALKVLRDRYNPLFDETVPEDQFDDGGTIANNGCIHSMIFLNRKRVFYFAAGEPPVPSRKYVGFSLDELFGVPGAGPPDPPYLD